jgi:hypothetical protein
LIANIQKRPKLWSGKEIVNTENVNTLVTKQEINTEIDKNFSKKYPVNILNKITNKSQRNTKKMLSDDTSDIQPRRIDAQSAEVFDISQTLQLQTRKLSGTKRILKASSNETIPIKKPKTQKLLLDVDTESIIGIMNTQPSSSKIKHVSTQNNNKTVCEPNAGRLYVRFRNPSSVCYSNALMSLMNICEQNDLKYNDTTMDNFYRQNILKEWNNLIDLLWNKNVTFAETRELRNAIGRVNIDTNFAFDTHQQSLDEFQTELFNRLPHQITDKFAIIYNKCDRCTRCQTMSRPTFERQNKIYVSQPKNVNQCATLEEVILKSSEPEETFDRDCLTCQYYNSQQTERTSYIINDAHRYCFIYIHQTDGLGSVNHGDIIIMDFDNFELPNSNGIKYEIRGIAFHNPAPDGSFGHYWTYIKYRDGWINLDCSKNKIVTLETSFVKNDFRTSLKLPGGAHANMLILKRKI